ncbi:transglycosylase domain-containing protein [Sphingomonas donggukensis]|uniref:Penicillin-binding protein 1A n=1 Tax=Sphingomonas donggukensis TaxID=2949093 RepID=A0ABY4TUJ8_9SPHN|nr:transglycosylase domain-containing protein [Sphingomonas donggukensis]URW75376.1 transglycosylase domain-containing protein [Sphingomonas donggukensis]
MPETDTPDLRLRLQREPRSEPGRFARAWQRRWVRIVAYLAAIGLGGILILWILVSRDLPSVDKLRAYEPPLPTNVRGGDGTPIHSYARLRRVELSYPEYPPLLVKAFLAAEDRTFFEHHGVDYPGIASAILINLKSDKRPVGASTITQQVAKNLLVGNQVSYIRKAREAVLAYKIEDALTKQQILELYLNQIELGRNAAGVEAASHAYFDKELDELSLAQLAYIAILPKGPSNYSPERNYDRAIKRRNFVLSEMLRNDFITQAQYQGAITQPLGTVARRAPKMERNAGYFVEEVRRQLLDRFGETDKAGPYSVYSGGLWVRTSFDPRLQGYAQDALREGLLRYDGGRGWSGPIRHLDDITPDRWLQPLLDTNIGLDYSNWRAGIVIAKDGDTATLGFADGTTGPLPRYAAQMPVRGVGGTAFPALKVGDILAVAENGNSYALRSIPRVSGAFVVEEPSTGRVLAMQGGFDSRLGSFNRATQAMRQPGSTIKPIVYSAALGTGMTPASIVVDGPFCVYQGARLGNKCFRNFGNMRAAGPHTMRWGIEQSRNLMTVRTAATVGMPNVVDYIQRLGVSSTKLPPYLSYALGAGETTVSRMVNAYAMLVNHGRQMSPTLIDYVQDRRGKVIWPANWRACDRCNARDWDGQAMPRPTQRWRQAIDAMTAYQMVHITEGVIQRGTATVLRDLGRPIMGKTGTTTGPTDVWFVGGTPQMVGGLYIGFDSPRNLGGAVQGGTFAAPIFKSFAVKAFKDLPVLPFRAPPGIRMVRIDRASGRPVFGTFPTDSDPKAGVIWEAFKPASEPRRTRRGTEDALPKATATSAARPTERPRDSDFLQREGGIY